MKSSFFAISSAGKLMECLRIQKVNAFKQLVQNRSNAEKTVFLCGSVVEHCVNRAKVVGSIPREHTYSQYKCMAWMHYKSLWIKASDKCKTADFIRDNIRPLTYR